MNDEYLDHLIHAHLDHQLDEAGHAELESLLRGSEANRQRFWSLAEVHGLAQQAVNIAWPDSNAVSEEPGILSNVSRRSLALRSSNRSSTMLAIGVMIGMLTTGVAWGISSVPHPRTVHRLIQESFESGLAPDVTGLPGQTGRWSGDFTAIVGPDQGIVPVDGEKMLQVLRADYAGKPSPEGSYFADLYRLVDLRPYHRELSQGTSFVQFSAKCNSIPFPDDERFYSSVSAFALTSDMVESVTSTIGPQLENNALAGTSTSCPRIDRDPTTWQFMECELRIPPETEFLLLRISVCHDEQHRRMTFEGQYLDDISLTLTQRP